MNWLERARREIGGSGRLPAANSAEGIATAAMAVQARRTREEQAASIGSNDSSLLARMRASDDVREAFEERAAIIEFDGGVARDEAESRAFESCIDEWITKNHEPTAPGRCAWCYGSDAQGARAVPFGTTTAGHVWLHPTCWAAWYRAQRRAAVSALENMDLMDVRVH